ncbi:MAG TPA: Uma2 family endonuclease [Polyangia bacterium]|jgi:Uma2 family endonuclease
MELGADLSLAQLVPRVPWEDYLRLEPPAGLRFEFDEGRLLVSPSGSEAHDLLIAVLLGILERYEEETQGRHCVAFPPHSFFMPPGERDYQPDVGIITDERKDRPLGGRTVGAPNIAVEVLSPSTGKRDRGLKAARYFEQGTAEYWLFDAEARTAELHRRGDRGWVCALAGSEGTYETPLLPGLRLDLVDIWARLDRKLRRA